MLHAYEDWNRIKKSGCLSNLATYCLASNYHSINKIRSAPLFGSKELGEILYLLSQIEQRAYLNGCVGEYVELMKIRPRFKFERLDNIIKLLPSYKNYLVLDEYFNVLENIKDNENQEKLLELFNYNSGIIGYADKEKLKLRRNTTFIDNVKNDFKTYRIKTYNGLLKLLKRKIELAQERFVSTISKLISDNSINSMQYIE